MPLRELWAVTVVTLKALSNVPVEPLLRAAERSPVARAAPECLLVLLSVRVSVLVNVRVSVLYDLLVTVLVLPESSVFE